MNSSLLTIIQSIPALAIVIVLICSNQDIRYNNSLKSTVIALVILHVCIVVYAISLREKDNSCNKSNNPEDKD